MSITTSIHRTISLEPDDELDIISASEVREADGERRWGSVSTLRRRLKSNSVVARLEGGKYVIKVAELDAKFGRTHETPQEWAARMAPSAPAMTDEQAVEVAAILRGGTRA